MLFWQKYLNHWRLLRPVKAPRTSIKPHLYVLVVSLCVCSGALVAGGGQKKPLDNRLPGTGKVHIQDHAKVEHSPFFRLKPFKIMVLDYSQPVALFHLSVLLETYGEKQRAALATYLPKVYSAILEDLYGVAPLLWRTGYHSTLMALRKRISRVCLTIVPAALLKDVLVEKALLKPMAQAQKEKA